jgi:uncharacterized damage-inducible protein DinB
MTKRKSGTNPSPYLIAELAGFSPQVGRLVAMMGYVRRTTLETVEGLSEAQLDHVHDARSNSIGALLTHVAAVEVSYQASTFHDRGLTAAEKERWGAALTLGARARREIRGHDLAHYARSLEEVRNETLRQLARRDDDWLEEETPFWDGLPANNHFQWFHVFEDELNHRGQMRWLVRRLPKNP